MERSGNSRFLMNQSKRNPTDFKRKLGFFKEYEETNENKGHPQSTFTSISAASKNKILAESNANEYSDTHLKTTPKEKLVINSKETHPPYSKISSFSGFSPYDPVNNYTSPRPAFLRYNPDRRKEILLRVKDEEASVINSIEEDSLLVLSSHKEIQEDEEDCSDVEVDELEEQEAEEKSSWCSRRVLKLLLLFGLFLFSNHYLFSTSSSSNPFQEKLPSNGSSLYRHLLRTHMGLSSECLDIGKGMCDLFFQGDSQIGHLGESLINDFVGSDEVNRALSLDEAEESVEDMTYKDGIHNVEDSVTLDEREVPKNSQESLEQGWDNRKEEGAKEEILGNETIENGDGLVIEVEKEEPTISNVSIEHDWNIQREESEKEENLENETIENGDGLVIEVEKEEPTIPNVSIEHDWNIQREESEKEEILANEASEILSVYDDFHTYIEALIGNNTTMEVAGKAVPKNPLRWKHVYELASESFQPLFLSVSLLTGMVGFLSFLFKYFAKSHKKPSRIGTKDSNQNPLNTNHCSDECEESFAVPRSPSADEKRIYPSVPVMEELRIEGGKYSNVNNFHLPSSSSVSDEMKGFYATRPPTVELLGEFSFVDYLASKPASIPTMKSKQRHDQPKIYIFEEPQAERRRVVNSSNEVHPYHAAEDHTSHEKRAKNELTDEKSGGKKAVITPLRRSNRLQTRVTSPTQ